MRKSALAALAAAALLLAGCSSTTTPAAPAQASAPVTLMLWHNYGTEQNAVAVDKLTAAYHRLHPNVTFKVVSQPGDSYFSLLQASAISKTGPDLAVMWTGAFTLKYKSFLTNLKGLVSPADLDRLKGLEWMSDGYNASSGPYVLPLENQFYIGFYNKKAFAKAGITSVPTTWSQLSDACTKLKAAGFSEPFVYGNGGQSLGAEFYPWYDASYLVDGAYSVEQLEDLYSGKVAWTSAALESQLSKWAALKSSGCTNSDVLTKTDNLDDFTSGKAAMIVDGTWDTSKFTDAMGSNVAAFVPPFSDKPIKAVVEYPGDGLAITSYSAHKAAAAAFLAYLTTDAAAAIIDKAGLISDVSGEPTSNPVNQQMLDFAAKDGYTRYPMLDNIVQGDVVDAGSKLLPSILAGSVSTTSGLSQLQQVWNSLSAAEKKPID
jgi:raffinose/stachyose/melibiose transport system substrate-binding protein